MSLAFAFSKDNAKMCKELACSSVTQVKRRLFSARFHF